MAADTAGVPEWSHDDLRRALEAAGVALWQWDVETDAICMDRRGYALWDVPAGCDLSFEILSEKIHPSDRNRVREAFAATRSVTGSFEIDFRTLLGKDVRWISARGQGNDAGIQRGEMTGVFLDITDRKQAEEGHELLAGEMSHRVKNLLAIAGALTKITRRSSKTIDDMSKQLMQRLMALGRAHDLVRPLPGGQGEAALLGDLFSVLLAPYDDSAAFAGRIRVAVPRMGIGETAATNLAMVVHELATNSVKYGALSVEEGRLDVSGTPDGDMVVIKWIEHGGPAVTEPASAPSFGGKLIRNTIQNQLGGSISYDWCPDGLIVTITLDAARVAAAKTATAD